jgi:hypothetical protein
MRVSCDAGGDSDFLAKPLLKNNCNSFIKRGE